MKRMFGLVIGIIFGCFFCCEASESPWYQDVVRRAASSASGRLNAVDKTKSPVRINWERFFAADAGYSHALTQLGDVIAQAHVGPNVQLLKEHPEAVHTVEAFKSLTSYFDDPRGQVNWSAVTHHMKNVIKNYPQAIGDPCDDMDLCWFVIARDKWAEEPLGFAQFLCKPGYKPGLMKVKKLMICPHAQHRGLGKILLSTLFKLVPDTRRIILSTLNTNTQALCAYAKYGFKPYVEPQAIVQPGTLDAYKVQLEYKAEESSTLQDCSKALKKSSCGCAGF